MRRDEQWIVDGGARPRSVARHRDRQPGGVRGEPELGVAHVEQQQYLLAGALPADPQGERGLLKLRGLGAGANQPRVTATEPDQPLVQPVVTPAVGRQVGRKGRKGRFGSWRPRRGSSRPGR